MGRTRAKRLRGYGNAIVRPLAVAFVEAVIESFADEALSLCLSTTAITSADPAIYLEAAPAHAAVDAEEYAAAVDAEERSAVVDVKEDAV